MIQATRGNDLRIFKTRFKYIERSPDPLIWWAHTRLRASTRIDTEYSRIRLGQTWQLRPPSDRGITLQRTVFKFQVEAP